MDGILFFLIFTALAATVFVAEQAWRNKKASKREEEPTKEPAKEPDSSPRKEEVPVPQPKKAASPAVVLYWYEPSEFKRRCRCCSCENPAGAVCCEVCGEKLC